ncbi:MAG: SDR family NAD(P)-dependent oxidoreductase [Pseudomonadota bacterium]
MTKENRRLVGKVALIAGSGPNINGGIAYELAHEGARLVCVDVRADYAEACARAIQKRGGEAIAVVCDVTREEQVCAAIQQGEAAFGPIDILINGAVVQMRKGLLDITVEEFRRVVDVALAGTFLFTKHVAKSMIAHERRGSIITLISTEAHQGNRGNIGYGTAKAGLLNFTRSVAMELAEHGIRVNSLTPTATDSTEGLERAADWEVSWEEVSLGTRRTDTTSGDQGVPLGKRPSPRHYGRAAVFLASDDAEMITGIDLRVDGGAVSRYWRWNPGTKIGPAD